MLRRLKRMYRVMVKFRNYAGSTPSHGSRLKEPNGGPKDKEGVQLGRWEIAGSNGYIQVEHMPLYSAKSGTSARRGATTAGTTTVLLTTWDKVKRSCL
jgi:hypothetical protein